jgi:single-stranded-DNA-specific exonuclease
MAEEIFDFSSSFNSMRWKLKSVDEALTEKLRLHYDIPDIVARVMVSRGIDVLSAQEFLNASFKSNCPNPSMLKDMDKAALRVAQAVKNGEKIAQFSDYDADGATSAAEIHLFLSAIGVDTEIVIPDRDSGYGPNKPDMQGLVDKGARVIITTDCGTAADAVLNEITAQGVDVIVIDHHEPDALHSPNVFALVNPKRFDEPAKNPFRDMAAAGLAFMFLIALNRTLREEGFYGEKYKEPNLLNLTDIVALGTVCDVVSLTGINRLLVKYGLKVLAARKNTGIKALSAAAGITSPISVYHLGFVLGPRINAGGRVGKSDLAVRLLCCTDDLQAEDIAKEMCCFNDERKQIEDFVLQQAISDIDSKDNPDESLVFVYGKDWHSGVVGIVAGRLKERYHVPAIVLSVDEAEGVAHASCRSVHGVDIGAAVVDCVAKGILLKGGGHTMAAGFTVAVDKLNEAEEFLRQHIKNQLVSKGADNLNGTLEIDALLDMGALNDNLIEKFSLLEPFGEGNPEPLLALKNVTVRFLDIRGQGHISCMIYGAAGGSVKAMAFKAADTELGNRLMKSAGEPFYVAGYLRVNEWQGKKTLQFVIIDAAA